MKLIEEVEIKLDMADLSGRCRLPARDTSRAKGMHLSGVLRHTACSSKMPGWERYVADLDTEVPAKDKPYPLIWFLGVAWEEACVSLYRECVWQPGETSISTSHGPVHMNSDGFSVLDTYGPVNEEFKYTSCKRKSWADLSRDWLKMQQGAGECLGYGTPLVRWHFCWNNQPWAPSYVRYLVEFEKKDLVATRQMIESNVGGAIDAGYGE